MEPLPLNRNRFDVCTGLRVEEVRYEAVEFANLPSLTKKIQISCRSHKPVF